MSSGVKSEEYRLSVPARDESLLCIRLTTAGVLAQCKIDMNMMDEFKHAVSEACYALIHQMHTASRLNLLLRTFQDVLLVSCSIDKDCPIITESPVPDPSVCITVLETMADKVEVESTQDGLLSITLYAYYM